MPTRRCSVWLQLQPHASASASHTLPQLKEVEVLDAVSLLLLLGEVIAAALRTAQPRGRDRARDAEQQHLAM